LYYTKDDNKLYLHTDSGSALTAPITSGVTGTIQNSQCSVSGAASSVSSAGNGLTLNLAISFSPAFAGTKNVYGLATDQAGTNSNWTTLGSWTVTGGGGGNVAPTALSATPTSGSGASQTFGFTYTDANGHADIHSARILIHPQIQGASACYLYYTKADNRLYLHPDSGTALLAGVSPGAPGTTQNSQCSIAAAASSASAAGNSLTLSVTITFTSGFAGTKSIYGLVQDLGGVTSGWVTMGAWNVP
jgi:hypothetical protein